MATQKPIKIQDRVNWIRRHPYDENIQMGCLPRALCEEEEAGGVWAFGRRWRKDGCSGSGLWWFGMREDRGGWSSGSGLERSDWARDYSAGFLGVELRRASGFQLAGGIVVGDGVIGEGGQGLQ
ncbi:unnamed protein product [Dovyalis caffra]|uniref:Uncharacterized protein n=1 Tax=Dovyalis caffra TaxID=77055 RepID=A0AAV1S9Q0_9ROSI|nr:unnamed protein product [Dovyalis caffra]